jgi:hypothetical protein
MSKVILRNRCLLWTERVNTAWKRRGAGTRVPLHGAARPASAPPQAGSRG